MSIETNSIHNCPVCGEIVGPHSRGITFHAKKHELTQQQYWLCLNGLTEIPKCQCSPNCTKSVSWKSWNEGFANFAKGHYDIETRSKNTKNFLLHSHPFKGKTKKDCETLRHLGKKTSLTLKKKFLSGEIKHWAKDHTKETHLSLTNRKGLKREKHHNWINSIDLSERIQESAGSDFEVKNLDNSNISAQTLDCRKNNTQSFLSVYCKRCSNVFERSIYGVIRGPLLCHFCDKNYCSKLEKEVSDFIKTIYHEKIYERFNTPFGELDIYIPNLKFAIEVNGLYWHSEAINFDKNYHQNKTENCLKNEISLMHIFEDEWRFKKEIIKSMIRHRLNLSVEKIGARKCSIVKLSTIQKKEFFQSNHIDGDSSSVLNYGLVYNSEIIAAASFRKPFHKKWEGFYELARFCTKKNIAVNGALSKLIKHFKKENLSPIMSYQDIRLGGKKSYEMAGFKLHSQTGISFWWTDTKQRYNRFSIKAENGISEIENSLKKRKIKIWGTKNHIWLYD